MSGLFDTPLYEREETDDHHDRSCDEQDLIPATLMGEHDRRTRRFDHSRQGTARSQDRPGTSHRWLNGRAMLEQIKATIEVIRPALQADGGDIELVGVDVETGIVSVRLVGACGTCPVSTQTLKGGIERIMRDRVDGVTEVVDVGAAESVI